MTITKMKPPKILLGGEPTIGPFSWEITRGPNPFFQRLMVTKESSERLLRTENPIDIEVSVETLSGDIDFKIKSVFLVENNEINEFHDSWTIADSRWFNFQNAKIYCGYNITRQSLTRETPQLGAQLSDKTSPSVVREPYDRYAVGRYLPDSVKPDGTPFSVQEILIRELRVFYPDILSTDREDNTYILENLIFDGVPVVSFLSEMSTRGRIGMSVGLDGNMYLYSYDFSDDKQVLEFLNNLPRSQRIEPSILYLQSKKKRRPKTITTRYRKAVEVVLQAPPNEEIVDQLRTRYQNSETKNRISPTGAEVSGNLVGSSPPFTAEPLEFKMKGALAARAALNRKNAAGFAAATIGGGLIGALLATGGIPVNGSISTALTPVVAIVNVIRAPFKPTNSKFNYNVNDWVPIILYLEEFGMEEKDLRERWWGDSLATFLNGKLFEGLSQANPNTIQQLSYSLAFSLKDAYRQTYMIDPYFFDRWENWETQRSAVVDSFSGYRQPSPLFSDYAIVVNHRPSILVKNPLEGRSVNRISNFFINGIDPVRLGTPPGTIMVLQPFLGTFKVHYPQDVTQTIGSFIPSCVIGEPTDYGGTVGLRALQANNPLSNQFTLETIVTAYFYFHPFADKSLLDTPGLGGTAQFDSVARYQSFTTETDGEGPPLDYVSNWLTAQVSVGGEIENLAILEDMAKAEAFKLAVQYKDRVQGYMKLSGFLKLDLVGNMNYIRYGFSESQGFYTEVDMLPKYKEIEETAFVNHETRQFVLKQIGRI